MIKLLFSQNWVRLYETRVSPGSPRLRGSFDAVNRFEQLLTIGSNSSCLYLFTWRLS